MQRRILPPSLRFPRLRELRRSRPAFSRRAALTAVATFVFISLIVLTVRGCHRRGDGLFHRVGRQDDLQGVIVVLDPGHGGTDSGARDAGLREDTLNYRLTSVVAAALTERGATVVFTVRSASLVEGLAEGQPEPPLERPADARLVSTGDPVRLRPDRDPNDLYRRAAVAAGVWRGLSESRRQSGRGVYFLALHCDQLSHLAGRGARVYFDPVRTGDAPPPIAAILKRRLTGAGLTNSPHGMVIPRRYGVLNPQYNPIPERALVEMLTLSNPQDRKSALVPAWRWRLARLIVDSIAECEDKPAGI